MTFSTASRSVSGDYDRRDLRLGARPQRLAGATALAGVASACVWILCANLIGIGGDKAIDGAGSATAADPVDIAATRGDRLDAATPAAPAEAETYALLFDSHSLGFAPGAFVRSVPQSAVQQAAASPATTIAAAQNIAPLSPPPRDDRIAQSAAVPMPPLSLAPLRSAAVRDGSHAARAAAGAPDEQPTLLEKLFGKPSPKPSSMTLAYAAPDDKAILGEGQNAAAGRYDRWTAVYDITAHKVYLPDGRELEAHSGYGSRLDDPRTASVRDLGVTPPDIYDLEPREALFHGVAALRMIPVDVDKVFGRSGILAHSYMLGPNGDSNGCVSFKDYDAFLQAYLNHEIKRIAVVTRLE